MATILSKGNPLLAQASCPVSWPDSELANELLSLQQTLADFRRCHG